jgi:hypothetical protein
MKTLVINAHEDDAHKASLLVSINNLTEKIIEIVFKERFPWMSYCIVEEDDFKAEYEGRDDEYYFTKIKG